MQNKIQFSIILVAMAVVSADRAHATAGLSGQEAPECRGTSRETELILSNRLRFSSERQHTATELAGTLKELKSGANKRALLMSAGFAVAFAGISYEGMTVLAAKGPSSAIPVIKGAGQWAAAKLGNGSVAKVVAGNAAYEAAKLTFAEKFALFMKPEPKDLKKIRKIGNESLSDLLPGVLDLSPREIEQAYEQIGRQHAYLEAWEKASAPEARARRNVTALGWDDYLDFRTLFEIADAKRRLYESEVGINRYLLRELRARCQLSEENPGFMLLTKVPMKRLDRSAPISTLNFDYSSVSELENKLIWNVEESDKIEHKASAAR